MYQVAKKRLAWFHIILIVGQRLQIIAAGPAKMRAPNKSSTDATANDVVVRIPSEISVVSETIVTVSNSRRNELSEARALKDNQKHGTTRAGKEGLKERVETLEDELQQENQRLREHKNKKNTGGEKTRGHGNEDKKITQDRSGAPLSVMMACATLVALCYTWMGYFMDADSPQVTPQYHDLDGNPQVSDPVTLQHLLTASAFVFWVGMPWSVYAASTSADCRDGAPDTAYGVYAGSLVLHVIFTIFAVASGLPVPPFLRCSGVMSSLSVLSILMVLDHMDVGTDVMFLNVASACSPDVHDLWLKSWSQIPFVGSWLVHVMDQMTFGGFALTLFVIAAYIPQFMMLPSFANIVVIPVLFALVATWASVGWFVALPLIAIISACITFSGLGRAVWNGFLRGPIPLVDGVGSSHASLAVYGGMLVFEGSIRSEPYFRAGFTVLTRIAFENLVQLWIQTSLFGLVFDTLTARARWKMMASMVIGLGVSFVKQAQIGTAAAVFVRSRWSMYRRDGAPWAEIVCKFSANILPHLLLLLFLSWIVAKLYYCFQCPSHVWNLSSGCVD